MMVAVSDNSATNVLIGRLGMEDINAMLANVGLKSTRLRRKMMDIAAAKRGDENVSTPREMVGFVDAIRTHKAADGALCEEMLGVMKKVDAYMRPVIPSNIEVASKPGDLDGVRTETGLVFLPGRTFIVSVMSTFLNDRVNPVGQVTGIVFDFFDKLAHANAYGRRLD